MIYSLDGELTSLENDFFVVRCNGIGFKCKTDSKTASDLSGFLNSQVKIFTVLNIRENSWDLFGFNDTIHVDCFKMLTSVTGVGPKVGLSILSQFYPDEVFSFVGAGQSAMFTKAVGVGEKMAKRIVLELKEKISKIPLNSLNVNNKIQAINALEVLGYSRKEVSPILEKLDCSLSVEEIIKQTLKFIGG